MRERIVERNVHRSAPVVMSRQGERGLLVSPIARSQHDDLDVLLRQPVEGLEKNVHPLLLHQPAHHGKDRHLGAGRKPAPPLERSLAGRLSFERADRVSGGDVGVGLRRPFIGIDPIENAAKDGGAMAQDAFKTPAVFRSLDLSRVRRAHGRQRVGVNEPPFQEVQIIEELQLARGEPIPSESRQRKVDFPEPPLVGEVMEGEDRPRARKGA